MIAIGAVGLLALALAVVALLGGLRRTAAARKHRARSLARGRVVAGARRRGGRDRGRPSGRSARVRARPRAPRRPQRRRLASCLCSQSSWRPARFWPRLPPARSAAGSAARGREEVAVTTLSPRRLAVEAAIVVSSLVGVYLLRRRGLADANGFDPYLAAVLAPRAGGRDRGRSPLSAAGAVRGGGCNGGVTSFLRSPAASRGSREDRSAAPRPPPRRLGLGVRRGHGGDPEPRPGRRGLGRPLAARDGDARRLPGRSRARRRLRCLRDRAGAAPHREVPAARPRPTCALSDSRAGRRSP